MSRLSANIYRNGVLWAGYDYENQAWVEQGVYMPCGHIMLNPLTGKPTPCDCYGKIHAGEPCNTPAPTSV